MKKTTKGTPPKKAGTLPTLKEQLKGYKAPSKGRITPKVATLPKDWRDRPSLNEGS